jgi:hypothetical protein
MIIPMFNRAVICEGMAVGEEVGVGVAVGKPVVGKPVVGKPVVGKPAVGKLDDGDGTQLDTTAVGCVMCVVSPHPRITVPLARPEQRKYG